MHVTDRVLAATPPPISSDTDEDGNAANGVTDCEPAAASITFEWHNLVAGDYTIEEMTLPGPPGAYTKMANQTFSVEDQRLLPPQPCVQASSAPSGSAKEISVGTVNDSSRTVSPGPEASPGQHPGWDRGRNLLRLQERPGDADDAGDRV
jgi:hypothetical protein